MQKIRNIAIIAHVDHGKTTLVDKILEQTNIFKEHEDISDRVLDSDDIERERGITILSKNISVEYKGIKINVIDTPGHSDFGGQVERVLRLADGVILLVDAAEGPMPQTRFVLDKALEIGLKPIVVINKVDKLDSDITYVQNKIFDLFFELEATEEQLDFPTLYASGRNGWAVRNLEDPRESINPLLDAIIEYVPAPKKIDGPVQFQVASLDYSNFVGRIGIGRVYRGTLDTSDDLSIIKRNGKVYRADLSQLYTFEGLKREETDTVQCGDLCAIVGIEDIGISDTIVASEKLEALPPIPIDEPTISMNFKINDSPFFGKEGEYVSSRHLRERLFNEVKRDVALRVEEVENDADTFRVSGRGVLHLSILIENMRREGYELAVAMPRVIFREIDGQKCEPIEILTVDVPSEYAGRIIEMSGQRRGELISMNARGDRQLLEFHIPTRGLIGFRSRALTASAGEAIVSHRFERYEPLKGEIPQRTNGTLLSSAKGKAAAYAIDGLQMRGTFFISPNEEVYEGMIVGENNKDDDLVVNVLKLKALTNMRASGSDRSLKIAPPRKLTLEQALEYINHDELVEVTPKNIRLRKIHLSEIERRRNRGKSAE